MRYKVIFIILALYLNFLNAQNPIMKTKKMMDEDLYWSIVDKSLLKWQSKEEQLTILEQELSKLSIEEMIGFRLRTDKLLFDSYTNNLWCAAYLVQGGCSDDSFQYFRCWLISRGKEVYYNVMKNPDNLSKYASKIDQENEFEFFWYVALTPFKEKTGKDLYEYIAEDFEYSERNYTLTGDDWDEENPASIKKICPKLFRKFGWQ